jgi:sulfur-oxidizing protein SoxX
MILFKSGKAIFTGALLAVLACHNVVWADAALDESIARGQALAEDRSGGNCYSCHAVEGAELPGNYGPPLFGMKVRYPDRAALKAQIADPRVRNPNTPMPPYGANQILTDYELESVVDYIHSL